MISDFVHARHLAEFGVLKNELDQAGLTATIIEKSDEMPLHMLLAALEPDGDGRERFLHFTFVPLSEEELEQIRLLQFFSVIPCEWDESRRMDMLQLLNAINGSLAIGHLGVREDGEIHFRYVHCVSNGDTIRREEFMEVVTMFVLMLDMASEPIEQVMKGTVSVAEASAKFLE